MKTFNIRYRSIEKLKDFLENNRLHHQPNLLVQIFTAYQSPTKVLPIIEALQTALPHAVIIGCSTDGEIIEGKLLTGNTVISITEFEKSRVELCYFEENKDAFEKGQKLAKRVVKKDTKAVILLAAFDALNAQELLDGLYHDRPNPQLVISGALAGDNGKFKSSFVFAGTQVSSSGIAAVGISGESLQATNYYSHDWDPVSREFKVDEVIGNHVMRIDGKPAKTLYNNYIGSYSEHKLPYYSLQFPFVTKRAGRVISKLAIDDPDDGSLVFTSNLKKGEILQIAFANIDKIDANIEKSCDFITHQPVETLFIYASSARRRFLEHFCHKEIETLKKIATTSGFFGYSEFFANSGQCNLLSQSMSILILSENTKIEAITTKTLHAKETNSLDYKTMQVLSNIAQVSSSELQELNKKLEQRVREGIRNNRKKDSIMIHNSKLAQLGEMMGLIAHQWRQPLSAISATATGMQVKFELDSWTPEYVESSLSNIEEYVLHLSKTIDDFTNFFKPTKKKESIQVREIIKKALFIMSPLLTKDNILVIKKYHSQNSILTYPNEVVQVVLNLIKNADNALKKRAIATPEIYINEYEKEGKNIIEISDNAGGIDTKIIDKIFEPYFSTKNSDNSMGLGLYMSKFIIEESCGGRLDVENSESGAKFTIMIKS